MEGKQTPIIENPIDPRRLNKFPKEGIAIATITMTKNIQ